jgi:hypothetical protein
MDNAADGARSEDFVEEHCEHLAEGGGAEGLSGGILEDNVYLVDDRKGNTIRVCDRCFHELQSRAPDVPHSGTFQ